MYISFTGGKVTPQQEAEVERFLEEFLPRMRKLPGVVAIYHYSRPEHGDNSTIVVWRDREAMMSYRSGDLIREVGDFEKKMGLHITRESYPVSITL